jgi:hypothetical protein
LSTKHRGRFEGAPVTRRLPTPAGGVRLETFVPWRLVPRGLKRAVITPPGAAKAVEAHSSWAEPAHAVATDTALMRSLGLDTSQVHRLMRLTLLAPEVLERLVDMPDLPVERLLGRPWPYAWADQARVLDTIR